MSNYEQVSQQLQAAGSEVNPSELHGMLCGLMAAGDTNPAIHWLSDCLDISPIVGDLLVNECLMALKELAERTQVAIDSEDEELHPLLVDDDAPIQQRAQSITDWCEGFNVGMGFALPQPKQPFSRQVTEAITSLSDITRMDVDELEESEENDNALMEVSEFLWVATMLIYTELKDAS